jgi:hypothetical protein
VWPGSTLLSFLSTDLFLYKNLASTSDITDYSGKDLDDSDWSSGHGPFTDQDFYAHTTDFPAPGTIIAPYAVWLRKHITVQTNDPINILLKIDNIGSFYVNGVLQTLGAGTAEPATAGVIYTPSDVDIFTGIVFAFKVVNTGTPGAGGNPIYAGMKASQ